VNLHRTVERTWQMLAQCSSIPSFFVAGHLQP
jgi:hypothetical protein